MLLIAVLAVLTACRKLGELLNSNKKTDNSSFVDTDKGQSSKVLNSDNKKILVRLLQSKGRKVVDKYVKIALEFDERFFE